MAQTFRWNRGKERSNFKKHGISFAEAATTFGDLLSITIDDPIHSHDERRLITIGIVFSQAPVGCGSHGRRKLD